jgi:hypothetical protein
MSIANPPWGAPRNPRELLKLDIDVGQTTVAKYMARRRRPPSYLCSVAMAKWMRGTAHRFNPARVS